MIVLRRQLLSSAAIVGFGWLSVGSPALAQAVALTVPSSAQVARDPSAINEVVVTAERHSELLKNTPISVSVIQGKQLDQAAMSMTEVLNTVPGVAATVDYQSGGTQLSIRGVSAAGPIFDGPATVAYYLDGMPFGFARSAVGPDLDPYDLNRVEILRGPQGTLYGAGGLNGVVRVLTNDPDLSSFDFKVRTGLSGTENGGANYGGDAEINVPLIKDVLAVRLVVGDNHESGWINSVGAKDVNDANLQNYRVKVEARPTDHFEAELSFWRTDDRYGAPSDGNTSYFNDALRPDPITSVYNGYGLKLSYDLPAFTATSQTSYLDYASTALTDLHPVGLPAGYDGVTDLGSNVFSEEIDLTSKPGGPFKWSGGIFYRDATDKVFQPFDTPSAQLIYDNFQDESKSWAVYGEVGQKFLDDKFEWTFGLRYFNDDATDQALSASALGAVSLKPFTATFHALTPRAVLQWYPTPNQSFYASYSQGFRSGVIQDEEVTVISPNVPPAKPDTLNNYEVGSKSSLFGGRVDLQADVFYIDWSHVQQVVQTPIGNGTYVGAIVNGASASGLGAEGSVEWRVTSQFRVSANLSWNGLAEDKNVYSSGVLLFSQGQRLNYSPEYTAGVTAQYSAPIGATGYNATLSGSANYTSQELETSLRGASRLVLPGDDMFSMNARLAVDSPDRKWTASLFADNVTNDNGSPVKSPSTVYFNERIRPRTVGVQLEYHY